MSKTTLYNVKLAPEVKEQWQVIIEKVMADRGYSTFGEVYPYLIQILNEELDSTITSDIRPYIDEITHSADALVANAMALNASYVQQIEQIRIRYEQREKELKNQIDGLHNSLDKYDSLIEELNEKINSLESECTTLRNENKALQSVQDTLEGQKTIIDLLNDIKASNEEKPKARTTRKTKKDTEN